MKRCNVYIVRYTDSHVLRKQTDGRFVVDYLENLELPARNSPGENGAARRASPRGPLGGVWVGNCPPTVTRAHAAPATGL